MFPSDKLAKFHYDPIKLDGTYEMKSFKHNISWDDIESTLRNGEYYTVSALSGVLGCDKNDIIKLLVENEEKLHSPKHRSPKTSEKYFVLKNKRDKFYETVRPFQLALADMF